MKSALNIQAGSSLCSTSLAHYSYCSGSGVLWHEQQLFIVLGWLQNHYGSVQEHEQEGR